MRIRTVCLVVFFCVATLPVAEPPRQSAVAGAGGTVSTPLVWIKIPTSACSPDPAYRPPVALYQWGTVSWSSDPAEVRYIMLPVWPPFGATYDAVLNYIRNNPGSPNWFPWQPYNPPGTGTTWLSPPLDFGLYVFAVHGRDAEGNADPDFTFNRNARRIRIGHRVWAARLTVTGEYIDPITTITLTTATTRITLPGGTPAKFCWGASAEAYCGVVVGYRYAWDVADPDDDEQWSVGFSPFESDTVCSTPTAFATGVHTFCVEIIDNDGYKTRVVIEIDYGSVGVKRATWGQLKSAYRDERM